MFKIKCFIRHGMPTISRIDRYWAMKTILLCLLLSFGSDYYAQSDTCIIQIPTQITMNCRTGEDYTFSVAISCPIDSCRFMVFNRWGEVLHSSDSKTPSWDARKQTEGTYFYHLTGVYANKQEFEYKGTVSLIR